MTNPKTIVRVSSAVVLLAAVLAWSGQISSVYADADSISVNFGADKGAPSNDNSVNFGVIPVSGNNWNNASGASGTNVPLKNNTGAATGVSGTWTSGGTWNFAAGNKPPEDNNGILYYGYLDDWNKPTFDMTSPYFDYNIYYYPATDSTGATPFRYITINSVNYCGGSNGTVTGTSNWGTPVSGKIDASALKEGVNYLKVSSSDSAISIASPGNGGNYRGSFGAVQIVNTADSQSRIISDNFIWTDSVWSNDLTGEIEQAYNPSSVGYRLINSTNETVNPTIDLGGSAVVVEKIKKIGVGKLNFTNGVTSLGKTNTVSDFAADYSDSVSLSNQVTVVPQGVVKFAPGVTVSDATANQSAISGGYVVDGSSLKFARITNGQIVGITPEYVASPTDGLDLNVTTDNITDNATRTLNSLTSSYDYKNNSALTITSGNIMLNNRNHWVQGGGTITSGYQNGDGEYDLYLCAVGTAEDMRIDSSRVVDNPNGKLNLIKTGSGKAGLTNYRNNPSLSNEYSGKTSVLEGTLFFGIKNSSTQFYVANGATLDFSCRNIKNGNYNNHGDIDFTATELVGYGTVIVGNSTTVGSLTLNNVLYDGSKFTAINAEGKHLTLNNSELHAATVNSSSVINLNNNSTLTADTFKSVANSTVKFDATSTLNAPIVTSAGSLTLDIPDARTMEISEAITGAGGFTKAGEGTLKLTANNTYSGNTQINGGVLDLTEGKLYSGAYAVADVYVNEGGTLKVNNFGYSETGKASLGGLTYSSYGSTNVHLNGGTIQIAESYGEAINRKIELQTNGGTLDLAGGVELTLGSDVHGAGGLTKAGAGTLTLSLQPAYIGATTISAGTLITTAGGTLYNLSGVASATLDNNGQAITVNNSADTVFSGTITGAGSFTKTGSGKLEITNKMAYTGDTTVSAGTLQLNGAAGNGKFFQGTVTISAGATLKCNVHDTLGYNSDEKVFNISGTLDNASGNESLRNTTLNLYGGTISSSGSGQLDILDKNTTSTGNKIFSWAIDGATATNPTVSTISSNIKLRTNGTLEIKTEASSQLKITGVIFTGSGNCTITKLGPGTLVLSALNEYKADTFVNEGTLELTAAKDGTGTLPPGQAVTVSGSTSVLAGNGDILGYKYNSEEDKGAIGSLTLNNGGTLYNNKSDKHITVNNVVYMNNGIIAALGAGTDGKFNFYFDNAIHVTGGDNNKITAAGIRLRKLDDTYFVPDSGDFAGLIDVAEGAKLTISSVIEAGSNVGMTKSGAGELVMTADSAGFTKGTTISQGTLTLKESGSLGTGAVAIAQNAVLNLNHDGDARFDNPVASSGAIYKNGNGVLKIYNPTKDAFVAESFIVNAGRLDFKGYFKGSLEIGEEATLSPGNSIGTLTIDGSEVNPQMDSLILKSGSTLLMEVGYDENNVWTSDKLIINGGGNVDIDPDSKVILTLLEGTALPSDGNFTLDLISGAGATEELRAAFSDVLDSYYFKDYSLTLDNDRQVITLSATIDPNAVPEPSTWALLALGAAGLLYWRKRK